MPFVRFVVTHATALMFFGVVGGIVLQPLAAWVRPLLLPLIFASLSLAIMRIDLRTLGVILRRPAPSLAHVAWLLLISPAAMYAVLLLLPVPAHLHGPLILFAATPPIAAMASFALLFRLDAVLVLIGVWGASLLSPISVPLIAGLVMGDQIAIGPVQLGLRLLLLLGGSLLAGMALRRLLGAQRIAGWGLQLDAVFVLFATLIGIALMDGIVAMSRADPAAMAVIVVMVLGASFVLFVLATLLFLPGGKALALGVGLNSGGRSIAMVLAVLGAAASDELVMVVAAAQLPIFAFPLFQRPLIRWVMGGTDRPAALRDTPAPQ